MAIFLTKSLEKKIENIIIAHRKLDIPPPIVAKWSFQVDDKIPIKLLSQSWVRNAYNYCTRFWGHFDNVGNAYGPGTTDLKSTDGTLVDITRSTIGLGSDALGGQRGTGYLAYSGETDKGILIGTDTTSESFESYNLGSLISHGVGGGQVEYSESDIPVLSWDSGNKKFICTYTRRMLNNSGGSITVGEVGLVYAVGQYRFLFARDVLSPTINLADAEQLTVDYTLEFPYP